MSAIKVAIKIIDEFSSTLTGLNQGFELVGKGISFATKGIDLAIDGMKALGSLGGSLVSSFSQVGNQFEQMGVRMETVFGGRGAAQEALDWATEFSAKTPYALTTVGDAMIKLKTQGFDPMSGIMNTIGDAASALGKGFDEIGMGLGRMQLTGKVSMEAINMLQERGVPALRYLKEEMGLTEEQLANIGNAGLKTSDVINAITKRMDQDFGGAMLRASSTAEGVFSTLEDIFVNFQQSILSQGIWDAYVKQLVVVKDVLEQLFETDEVKQFAEYIGKNLASMFNSMMATITENIPVVISGIFDIAKSFAVAANNILDTIDQMGILTTVEFIVAAVIDFVQFGRKEIITSVGLIISKTIEGFSEIIGLMGDMARENPSIAEIFGIDPVALADMEVGFKKAARGVQDMADSFVSGFDKAADFGRKINAELSQAFRVERIDVGAIDAIADKVKSAVGKINIGKQVSDAIDTSGAVESAKNTVAEVKAIQVDTKELAKAQKKAFEDQVKNEQEALKERKDAYKEQLKNEKDALKERQDLFREVIKEEKEKIQERYNFIKEGIDAEKKRAEDAYDAKKAQIEEEKSALKERKDAFKAQIDEESDALKERKELEKEKFDKELDIIRAQKDALLEQTKLDKEALQGRKEAFSEQMQSEKEALKERQDAFREQMDAEESALSERISQYRENYDKEKSAIAEDRDKKAEIHNSQKDLIREQLDAIQEQYEVQKETLSERGKAEKEQNQSQIDALIKAIEAIGEDKSLSKESKALKEKELQDEVKRLKELQKERDKALEEQLYALKKEYEQEKKASDAKIKDINKAADAEGKTFKDKLKALEDQLKAEEAAQKDIKKAIDAKKKQEEDAQKDIEKVIAEKARLEEKLQKSILKDIEANADAAEKQYKDAQKNIDERVDAEEAAQKKIQDGIEARKKAEEEAQKAAEKTLDAKRRATDTENKDIQDKLKDRLDAANKLKDQDLKRLEEEQSTKDKSFKDSLKKLEAENKSKEEGFKIEEKRLDAIKKAGTFDIGSNAAEAIAKAIANAAGKGVPGKDGKLGFDPNILDDYGKALKDQLAGLKPEPGADGTGTGISESEIMIALARWLKKQLASDAMGENMPIVSYS
jgi:tape measure domain-containing protein